MAKQRVTLEVLSYHATAPVDEALKLKVCYTNLIRANKRSPLVLHIKITKACEKEQIVALH